MGEEEPFYFVHSFVARPAEDCDVLATAEHGERFACAIARDNVFGAQFHPEKSSAAGLRLLRQLRRDLRRRAGMSLTLYPAIDIRGGSAVRLMQGDYERETAYDADPLDAATRWVEGGAEWLHIVDLDGARSGISSNLEHVRRICHRARTPGPVRRRPARRGCRRRGASRRASSGS